MEIAVLSVIEYKGRLCTRKGVQRHKGNGGAPMSTALAHARVVPGAMVPCSGGGTHPLGQWEQLCGSPRTKVGSVPGVGTLWDAGDQHPKTAQSLVWDV